MKCVKRVKCVGQHFNITFRQISHQLPCGAGDETSSWEGVAGMPTVYLTGSSPFHHASFSFVLAGGTTLQLIVIFLWLFPVHCNPARLLVASIASPRFQNQNGILMCWGPEPVRFLTLGPMESGSVFLQVEGLLDHG